MKQLFLGLLWVCLAVFSVYAQAETREKNAAVEPQKPSQFALKDTAGITHQLHNYKGKWVLVNYWATWCPPCLEEVPDLVNLYDKHKNKDLMVLGVVFEYKDTQEVATYVDDMLMSYPIVLGDDEVVKQVGSAEVMPTTYIYNPKGQLVKIKRGLITKAYIEKLIASGG